MTFPKVDVCAVHERDSVKSGPCGRYGSTLGNRGLWWHEESLHGECEKYSSFDFTTFVSGWDVQPWRRLLVLRSQHGVPRRRRWCWGDPNGLSQPHSCTWSQWWSQWSESTTLVPLVPMIPMVWVNNIGALGPNYLNGLSQPYLVHLVPMVIPMVWVHKPHRRTAQLYPPYQWNPISGTASQLCIFSCKLSVIHNFEPSPLKFGPQNKSCQNQNELFSEFCLLENCCKT